MSAPRRHGRLITLEGGEGAGKSTQIRLLAERLRDQGVELVLTREPGGSVGAEEIRSLIVSGAASRWDVMTEALLVFAARRDHVERTIRPALAAGQWVLCDRFLDSTYAYQGQAGGLSWPAIDQLADLVLGDLRPDLTVILDLPVAVGLARAQTRDGAAAGRFEQKGEAFHQNLRQAFHSLAARNPARYRVIDANRPIDQIAAEVAAAVLPLLA